MLIAIAVVLFLAKIIFKPLNMITKNMHEIANGNGNLKHRLDDSGDDEIAYFANGFNSFISKLDYIIDRVTETSSLLQRQSEELINLSRQGKGKSLDQKNTMSNVVDSIHEITANVDKNTEYANSTSEVTAIANERANDGKKATNAAVSAIEAVASDVNAASQALKELEGGSKEIAEVLSVIDDISNQTNLLALNAAIEAAWAGENGRGFAVVADEVRSLSYRIQTETHSIAETIGKLQKGTADAVHTMEQSVGYSESGVELATEAGVTLDAVVESSSQITKMNSKIADATKQQSVIIHNINANIEAANGLAEDTTQSVIAIDGIGNQISSLANEMQGLVFQFNQGDR